MLAKKGQQAIGENGPVPDYQGWGIRFHTNVLGG
jgi:hypothetical protein